MDLKRWAGVSFVAFVATLGVYRPRPPLPGHAIWADVLMALTMLALSGSILQEALARGPSAVARAIPPRARLPLAAAAVYVGWAIVSSLATGHGYWKLVGLAELACVFAAATVLGSEPRARAALLRALVWGTAALALTGLATSVLALSGIPTPLASTGGAFGWIGRPQGLAVGTDMLGTLCLPPLLLLADTDHVLGLRRILRAILIAIFAITLALTLSRSVLSLGFGLALLYLPSRRLRIAAGVTLLVPLLIAFRFDLVRPDKGLYLSTEPSLRLLITRGALGTIAASPLVGTGPDGVVATVQDRANPGGPPQKWDAHLTWFDVPANLGLPALAAFFAFVVLVVRAARQGRGDRAEDPFRRVLWVIAAVMLFESLSIDMEDFRHVWLLLGLLVA